MSQKQEANAHGLSHEGQPLLYRQQQQVTPRQPQVAPQVTCMTITPIPGDRPTLFPIRLQSPTMSCTRRGSQEGGHSVPLSRVTGPQRLSVSDLPPLHGPHLTLAPPRQLSAQTSRAFTDCVKLPPLSATAASGSSPRGTESAVGPMGRGQPECVPPLPWGTLAVGTAQGTPSLESRTEGLWTGSVSRQAHPWPSVAPARGVLLSMGMQPAWKPVWHSVSENPQPLDTSVKELEKKGEVEELPETQAAGERDSDLQSALLASLKENEGEEEACARDPWGEGHSKLFLSLEPEENSGFSASPLSGGPCEDSATEHAVLHKQLWVRPENLCHPMHKKREELEKVEEDKMYTEFFGDIFSSMDNEESPKTSSCDLRDPSIASLEPGADSSVPLSACSVTKEASGETQNYSELVSPELSADLGSDSEDSLSLQTLLNELMEKWEQEEEAEEWDTDVESPLSIPPRDEELEPAPTPPDSDQEHSEPLPRALPQEPKGFAGCALPADATDEAEAAGMEAGSVQAASPQEKPCREELPAGACPVPAQPLAGSVPACPAGSAAIPQPPAPRPWRSMAKRARRALRRFFSFSCLRGQPEE